MRAQCGLVTRAQLAGLGIDRWAIRHRVAAGRWLELTPVVIGTTTGVLTREKLMWLGVLHAGRDAMLGELTAAEVAGLRNWHRDHVSVLIDKDAKVGAGFDGVEFVKTRRPLPELRRGWGALPVCRIEPAVLLFASRQRSARTAEGVLAAVVQQRLTTSDELVSWLERLQRSGEPRGSVSR